MADDLRNASERELQTRIADALRDLKFGSVEIVVHGGRIVQIERRERYRFDHEARGRGAE